MLNAILLTMFISWGVFGVMMYAWYHDDIPNVKKRMLFMVMCGPLVWVIILTYIILGFFLVKVDDQLVCLIEWLRKP